MHHFPSNFQRQVEWEIWKSQAKWTSCLYSHRYLRTITPHVWAPDRHLSFCAPPQMELFQMWSVIWWGVGRGFLKAKKVSSNSAYPPLSWGTGPSTFCKEENVAHTSPLLYHNRLHNYAPLIKHQTFKCIYIMPWNTIKTISIYLSHNYKQPAFLGLSATGTALPAGSSAW